MRRLKLCTRKWRQGILHNKPNRTSLPSRSARGTAKIYNLFLQLIILTIKTQRRLKQKYAGCKIVLHNLGSNNLSFLIIEDRMSSPLSWRFFI
jgi:hypothetical protein